ncbi:DUF3426 domain-containing protein [Polaromonas sp.]|uniref:DUF3426 domain-containing protein n=1 Tax=Polaromonas sp. TaxID=1869339 RepID=UPI002FCC0779
MSLITRCPACGTMFKVVTDQLKISQGWVRCGHCAEVFDASAHLQTGEAASVPVPETPAADEIAAPAAITAESSAEPYEEAAPEDSSWAPARSFADQRYSRGSSAMVDAQDSAIDFDPAGWRQQQYERQQDDIPLPVSPAAPAYSGPSRAEASDSAIDSDYAHSETEAHDVSFVREARRKAFWRKPMVRFALGVLALLLLATLALQGMVQQRDRLAALEPRLQPWLQLLCVQLDCEIGPLRHIESVVVDSSSFNKLGSDAYRLSFTIKNTSAVPLAMPSLELSLTDSQEQALVRRVLTPAQFGARAGTLEAGADFAGMVVLKVSGNGAGASVAPASSASSTSSAPSPLAPLRIAGYRVLVFYP